MAIIQALSGSRLILLLKRGVKSRLIIDISFNLFIESDIEKSYIGLLGTIVLFVILSYLFITGKIILMDFYTGLAISIVFALLGLLS